MLFPFPLLCALVLILCLSGCFGGGDGGDTDGGDSDDGYTESGEAPAQVLTRDELPRPLRNRLITLSNDVFYLSDDLTNMENANPENLQLPEVLAFAQTRLMGLLANTDELKKAFHEVYKDDADTLAPGLAVFSKRLELMLEVIQKNQAETPPEGFARFTTPQEALEKFRKWADELTGRANALPDDMPEPEPEPEPAPEPSYNDLKEKLDSVSADLGALSEAVEKQSGVLEEIAQDVAAIPRERPNVASRISAVFSVLAFLLVLSLRIRPPAARKADSVSSGEEDKTAQVRDMLKELAGKLDALSERVDTTPQSDILEDIQFRLDALEKLLRKPLAAQSAQAETQYFKVTSSAVADGQPVYLRKRSIRSEIFGTLLDDNSQTYSVFPAMTQTTENGMRGVVASNVLYTGDIRRCFKVPKERPLGLDLYVTVEEPALIRLDGNQYRLIRPGKLSVASGPS